MTLVTSQHSDHPGITSSVVSEQEKQETLTEMGILRSNRDIRGMRDPSERRARSEYSDMVLAEQFTNPQEILDKIRVRPRLASPSPVRPEVTRQSVRRVKRRQKRLRWSDASMARSASSDHLATMRSSCHCNCDLEDRRGMSLSVGSLCDMLEERQECHVTTRVQKKECVKNISRVKSEEHVYVNCDSGDHTEAYNSLMRVLVRESGQSQRTGRREHPRKIHHLSPGCMVVKISFSQNGSITA